MKSVGVFAALLGLAAASSAVGVPETGLEARQDPNDLLIFVCNQGLGEICTNMCYGAYCRHIGVSLQYDKPDKKTFRNRRKAAGCIASGGNRCSVKQNHAAGYQCDEYPFASTKSSGAQTRLNRCVPAGQNQKQGGIISKFYSSSYCKGNNGGKCKFNVEFSNAGNIDYCQRRNCGAHDDNERIGPGGNAEPGDTAEDGTDNDPTAAQKREVLSRNGLGKRLGGAPVYRTSSGLELDLPNGAQIGQRAFVVLPRNATLWDEQAEFGNPNKVRALDDDEDDEDEDEDYEYMMSNLDIREDTIVEEITPPAH